MPTNALTLDDFRLLSKYEPAVSFAGISDGEKEQFRNLRQFVAGILREAQDQDGPWMPHLSVLNPSGRTAKQYWCAIYPVAAPHKSYAPQIAFILSGRGVEMCFALGAAEGEFGNPEERAKSERYLAQVRQRLLATPEELRVAYRTLPETWLFRSAWLLPPSLGEHDSFDLWLEHAGSASGAKASISRYLTISEAIERGDELAKEFVAAIQLFSPLLAYAGPQQAGDIEKSPAAVVATPVVTGPSLTRRTWLIAAGEGGRLWDQFRSAGEVTMGLRELADLRGYATRDAAAAAIREHRGDGTEPINDALAAYEFTHVMQPGDIVYVKRGLSRVLGAGTITSGYEYDPNRPEYKNVRKVTWTAVGDWQVPDSVRFPVKTLTEISRYDTLVRQLQQITAGIDIPVDPAPVDTTYPITTALADIFLTEQEWLDMLGAWSRKKNLVLQGAPGVGKTFVARRLAYSLLGRKAPAQVSLLQFHQSYSYEEFVEGYRPSPNGGLVLRDGVFKEFCKRALQAPDQKHVLIVDEINRGHVSKIFGELLSLVEADKRGPEHALTLGYSGPGAVPFFVPQNVYLLGLMNTADRSLAFVDYALRRRFAFHTIEPAFGRPQFLDYLQAQGVTQAVADRIIRSMTAVNDLIARDERNLGPGYQVGHSYFCVQRTEDELGEAWLQSVLRAEVLPLLEEYWVGVPGKLHEARALLQS